MNTDDVVNPNHPVVIRAKLTRPALDRLLGDDPLIKLDLAQDAQQLVLAKATERFEELAVGLEQRLHAAAKQLAGQMLGEVVNTGSYYHPKHELALSSEGKAVLHAAILPAVQAAVRTGLQEIASGEYIAQLVAAEVKQQVTAAAAKQVKDQVAKALAAAASS